MSESKQNQNCQCSCGENKFTLHGKPIMRAYCHCTICQEFNEAPYGDITLFLAKDVDFPKENSVAFKAYTKPPMVQRGKCTACDKPAIEFFKLPLGPKVAIVPSSNIKAEELIPEPSLHMFYHSRVSEHDDTLPKYSGYLKSQLAFGRKFISSLIKR